MAPQMNPQMQNQMQQPVKPQKEKAPKAPKAPKQPKAPNEKKGSKVALIIILIAVFVILAGAAVFYFFFGGDKLVASWFGNGEQNTEENVDVDVEEGSTDTGAGDEVTDPNEVTVEDEGLSSDLQATYDYILSHTSEDQMLDALSDFAVENHCGAAIQDKLIEYYDKYQEEVASNVSRFNNEPTAVGWYMEIKAELTSVQEYADKLIESGVKETLSVPAVSADFDANYKQRFIDEFEKQGYQTLNDNGVVSRSCLWNAVTGVEETGLFDMNDNDDALHVCYNIGLAMHVDSELDSMGSDSEKREYLREMLPKTDYSPLLIYYLSKLGESDAKAAFEEFREYSGFGEGEDIGAMRNFLFQTYRNDRSVREKNREIAQRYI